MSYKVFTWWRRFHAPISMPKKMQWQGYSELLQRIEWGEFEYNQLSEQSHLEEVLFQNECDLIKLNFSHVRDPEIIEEKVRDRRKLKNKRVNIMLEQHMQQEGAMLHGLAVKLAKEFKIEIEYVKKYMEDFNGTTRQLFYTLKAFANNWQAPTFEEIDLIPRLHQEFPRHILKDRDPVLQKIWRGIVKERKIWNAYAK